jgi:predicted transcriptional regulator
LTASEFKQHRLNHQVTFGQLSSHTGISIESIQSFEENKSSLTQETVEYLAIQVPYLAFDPLQAYAKKLKAS